MYRILFKTVFLLSLCNTQNATSIEINLLSILSSTASSEHPTRVASTNQTIANAVNDKLWTKR